MAILSNVSLGAQAIGTGDTTLIEALEGTRVVINAASIKETAGSAPTIDFYTSPDTTSASGTLIGSISMSTNGDDQPLTLIGRGFADDEYLIGVASATGSNISLTITTYDGGN